MNVNNNLTKIIQAGRIKFGMGTLNAKLFTVASNIIIKRCLLIKCKTSSTYTVKLGNKELFGHPKIVP